MKKILLVGVLLLLILVIIIPLIIYQLNRSETSQIAPGPNPTEEFQKFVNDKTITKIYFGILPCDDCSGVETVISLSQVDENATQGSFVVTKTYLGSDMDTEEYSGVWRFSDSVNENSNKIYVLSLESGIEEMYEQIDSENLIMLDEDGSQIRGERENYILKLL